MNPANTTMPLLILASLLLCATGMQGRIVSHDTNSLTARPWGVVKQALKVGRHFGHDRQFSLSTIEISHNVEALKSTKSTSASSVPSSNTLERHHHHPQIVLMGGPSSGKGTQSHRIVEHYDLVHLSTGDMLRETVERDSATGIGAIAKDYMERGELVPDEIITQIVLDRISQPDCLQKGWILDGFPRTRVQAEALKKLGIIPDLFIFLNVPDSELTERVIGRRTDPITGKIYHVKFFPPPTEEIRDRLVLRSDDTLASMENRLKIFHGNVDSVRQCYEDVFVELSGLGTPDEVAASVFRAIDEQHRVLENQVST
jgi:adenylate kinase